MNKTSKRPTRQPPKNTAPKPLFALISQILIALTVEVDNQMEKRMTDSSYPGAGLSWNVYARVMRFVPKDGITVGDLAAHTPRKSLQFILGCLERWHFIELDPATTPSRRVLHKQSGRQLRDGWGSGRGICKEWIARATPKGQKAIELWTPLFAEIETRWCKRFGEPAIANLRQTLASIISKLNVRSCTDNHEDESYPLELSIPAGPDATSLPILFSQLLFAFAFEFSAESKVPLAMCANAIRVLGENPATPAQLPRLTGASKEQVAIGWRLKRFIDEAPDPQSPRGKLVSLNPLGQSVYKKYLRLVREIEASWQEKFPVRELRASLEDLLAATDGARLRIIEGLTPPPGVARAGTQVAALGRMKVASAAKQRGRDLVEQTQWFLSDPAGSLPWFPLWDMNRGFGV